MLRLAALLVVLAPSVALAGFSVSSFKPDPKGGDHVWNAGAALDSQPETCWMVDPEKKNEGQYIELDVPSSTIDKIGAVIGWDKGEEQFKDFARIKKARVEIWNMGDGDAKLVLEHPVEFEDKRGWQIVDVPNTKVGGEILGGRVRLTVTEVYPGTDYPNLAVSEVRVHLEEFDAETLELKEGPSSHADGHDAMNLIDDDGRSFWAASGSAEGGWVIAAAGYGLSSVGIHPGRAPYARPKTVEITVNEVPSTHQLEDKAEMQWLLIPPMVGYTGSGWGDVKVRVVDTYPGEAGKGVAVAEVDLKAATIEDF